MKAPLLSYFGEPSTTKKLKEAIRQDNGKIQLTGLAGSSFAVTSGAVIRESKKPHVFIFEDKEQASYFLNDIESLLNNEIFFYPASYRRAYQFEETNNANILLRSEVLNKLNNKRNPIIITYSEALSEKVINRKELKKQTILLKKGEEITIEKIENLLLKLHFTAVDFVVEPGEFSIRGGIIDVFSYANEHPYRVEFFDNKIESIRSFNINTQLSISLEEKIEILPNTEAKNSSIEHVSFLEYLPRNSIIWCKKIEYTKGVLANYFNKAVNYFNALKGDIKHQNPELLFTNGESFCKDLTKYIIVEHSPNPTFLPNNIINSNCKPILEFNKQLELFKKDLIEKKEKGFRNIILCSSKEQEKRFHAILSNNTEELKYLCIQFTLHEGFIDTNNKLAVYTDHQIFNRYHRFKPKIKFTDKQAITIKQLTKLQVGDYVTHIDHGIGQFSGLHSIDNDGKKQEVIKLNYKNGDILYISIHALHKIAKYAAKEGLEPKINQLGSPAWNKSKQKTKKRIKEMAFNLIKLYAKRKKEIGFSFAPDSYLQNELEASFIYEDTPDQIKATEAIKEDMEKQIPMDRLICGDVGFGKTEIAIRAAFKAVTDSKQVAVLVPTTILALQHFKTFQKRLNNLPCNVDYINRFKTNKQQTESLKRLKDGETDIFIGTHRIISKDVRFKDLGLLIIDEEQKFGVNVKDMLKTLKSSIDTLTLSATPIPRTLQFSLMGARDLSIINTPPPNRQSIETRIIHLNQEIIRDAISYEMSRNGQVFFVHNRIENIKEVAGFVQRLCPDAKIKTGHGKMEGRDLEYLMLEFMEGEFDVLISTTIIENGLDIPNANTIIINNAQNFGLSDLHQMRGRVGRSNKQAFCYLIAPPTHELSNDARKRLNALEQFSNLGSGLNIAMRDLDIRGAGDLLGADQSGFINLLGFEMYHKILNEAIKELKEERFQHLLNQSDCYLKESQLETDLEIQIPDTYITNVEERLSLYKELAEFSKEKDLILFEKNLKDRFGPLPKVLFNLFDSIRLKWLASKLNFTRILIKKNQMRIYLQSSPERIFDFNSETFTHILEYLKNNPKQSKMKKNQDKIYLLCDEIKDISDAIGVCNQFI
ncbi:MAG: transcription-repair coupling factor [Bacteroidota bacterium]|nr:transcription-repair coupling factor [Bacteroidota bacterium]